MANEQYHRYLASREWALLKNKVARRSFGLCENCHNDEATQVHHLTYARIYKERLVDLQHVCNNCHEFLSARTDTDPTQEDLTGGFIDDLESNCVGWRRVRVLRTLDKIFVNLNDGAKLHPTIQRWKQQLEVVATGGELNDRIKR